MNESVLLMVFLACNLIITFLNILITKSLITFWKDCMEAIKKYHDSNYELAKSITKCVTNIVKVLGYEVKSNDTRTTK